MRQHLAGFVESYADCMDAWVMAAAQAGKMSEALEVEEWRRCRSELPYFTKDGTVEGDRGASLGKLQDIAKEVNASFLVIFKLYEGCIMTWVLSGETGELVHSKLAEDVWSKEFDSRPEEWVKNATFREWDQWQRALKRALRCIKNKTRDGRAISDEDLRKIAKEKIPVDMKDDLDEELWESIRDPKKFESTVNGKSEAYKELKEHYFLKAGLALSLLSDKLWKPILKECQVLKSFLDGGSRCAKPVSYVCLLRTRGRKRVWCAR